MVSILRRKGVQIIEEALLILVALMAIAVTVGVATNIQDKVNEIIQKVWEGLDWLFKTTFYFLP